LAVRTKTPIGFARKQKNADFRPTVRPENRTKKLGCGWLASGPSWRKTPNGDVDGKAASAGTRTSFTASSPYMPRYFFNTHGIRPITDEVGEELPDDETAWHEATIIAGQLLKDIDGKFRPDQEWALEVTDEEPEAALCDPDQRAGDEVKAASS
jgi:hypothetical protein